MARFRGDPFKAPSSPLAVVLSCSLSSIVDLKDLALYLDSSHNF
jgi:hypothetical protein